MISEDEVFPDDANLYTDECPESCRLPLFCQCREFTMGAGCFHTEGHLDPMKIAFECPRLCPERCCQALDSLLHGSSFDVASENSVSAGPDKSSLTFHTKVLLLTELITEIHLFGGDMADSETGLTGVTFVREEDNLSAGCIEGEESCSLKLDPENPFFKKVTMQQVIFEADPSIHRLEKFICYLCLESLAGEKLEFGDLNEVGTIQGKSWLQPEVAEGKLCITGVGFADAFPVSMQLVDVAPMGDDVDDALERIFYGRDVLSFTCLHTGLALYEHHGMIAMEDPSAIPVLEAVMEAVEHANPSWTGLLPNAINIIDDALAAKMGTTASVLRLDRYLTHVIQKKLSVGMWDASTNHYKKLIPLKQQISILARAVGVVNRYNRNKPSFTVYSWACLSGDKVSKWKAYLTFAVQVLLVTMLCLGMEVENFGTQTPSLLVSVLVSFVIISIAWAQMENYNAIKETFPKQMGKSLMWLDWITNKVLAVIVVIANFLLLGSTAEYLDLVLNSTATLFIVELDDVALSVDHEGIVDALRSLAYRLINEALQNMDKRYWAVKELRRSHPKINLKNCALVW
jgi:hypothetical protein